MHQFHRLPLDGQLYRLVWAGKIGQPRQERATPRIHLWFAKIDDTSTFGLRYTASSSGLPQVLWLDESAGSIGMFPIGSFWRDGVRQDDAMYALPRDQKFRHVILPAQSWTLVSSNDYVDQGPAKYVNRSDYPLSGENHKGDREYFYDGLLIRCVASDGQLLLIPCYEVFRRFFAVSSELSNALLSGHWATEVQKLVHTDRSGVASDGKSYTVWPKGEMSRVACLALARFDLVDSARAAAASIYVELENARNRERRSGHWIVARPPWADESLRISFIGHKLSSGAVLVLRIFSASFPAVPLPVTMVREHLVIPSFIPPEEEPTLITNSVKRGHAEDEHTHIGGPEDPRNGHRVTQLPLDEPWEGVPFVKRTYARQTVIKRDASVDEGKANRSRFVSTGKRGPHGSLPRGSFNPDEHTAIQSRFGALDACFQEMLENGDLQVRRDYGLVDPRTTELATYCQFPIEIGGIPQSWSLVAGTQPRPRLCWVSQLVSADSFACYWLEIEPVGKVTQKFLLLKSRNQESELSSATLRSILKAAVVRSGVWTAEALSAVDEEVIWIAKRHSYLGTSLRRSSALAALRELRRKQT